MQLYNIHIDNLAEDLRQDIIERFDELEVAAVENGIPYIDYVKRIIRPISDEAWFEKYDVPNEIYDNETENIKHEMKEIDKRIKDADNKEEITEYENLKEALGIKQDTLDALFSKKLSSRFRAALREMVGRNAKLAFERFKRWVKSKLPKFLASMVISIAGIVFSIYELAFFCILDTGGEGLEFVGSHFLTISILILAIILTYLGTRRWERRVRIRGSP